MRRILPALVFLLVFSGSAVAALTFPALTGRVVDEAGILSAPTKQQLDQKLADHEAATTNQVVVVTLKSLRGVTIEDYGVQLGRHWGIGQKGKNNGVLLIVAPKEKKVRIEVGYGLEGTLTDAMSSDIIHGTILPDFRAGHMEEGVVEGTQAILSILNGQAQVPNAYSSANAKPSPDHAAGSSSEDQVVSIIILALFFIFFIWSAWNGGRPGMYGGFYGGSFGSGGGFGGGFSGGGGSFGGGGASGGW